MKDLIAVIGAGSWGTALSVSLASAGHNVSLWVRRDDLAQKIIQTRTNPDYLTDVVLPDSIKVTSDLRAAVASSEVWVFATPSHAVRDTAAQIADLASPGHVIVSVAKGIEETTLLTTTQVLRGVLDQIPTSNFVALYGPSHAEEVAAKVPTAVVAAGYSAEVAARVQEIFMAPWLRVYVNGDVLGVEVAGSVKNVMAIAAGISDGVGFGDNAKAALITRGIAEIRRLGVAMGADPTTFSGLAGIGDLVVTCMSKHSRNRFLGEQIGMGRTLDEVQSDMQMIAEGVRTTRALHQLARLNNVEMPITEAVHSILFEGKKPEQAVRELMTRAAKHEDWLPRPADLER